MIDYFKLALSKYAQFTGRSRRSEYWYFGLGVLALYLAAVVLSFVFGIISESLAMIPMGLFGLAYLGLIVPSLAVAVRRMHDVGRSGWWLLLSLIPLGGLVVLYWAVSDSQPGANQWGPNPKTGEVADISSHLVD